MHEQSKIALDVHEFDHLPEHVFDWTMFYPDVEELIGSFPELCITFHFHYISCITFAFHEMKVVKSTFIS